LLNLRKISSVDGASFTGKYSTLTFSRANRFNMSDASPKRLAVALAAFGFDRVNLMRIASSGHEIDVNDEGSLTVMLPLRGSVRVDVEDERYQASAGGVLCFGPSRRRTCVVDSDGADFEAYLLKMPVAALSSIGLPFDDVHFETGRPFIPTASDSAPALRDLIGYIFSDLESPSPLLVSQRASDVAEALVHEQVRALVESQLRPQGRWARRKVRQAEEFMRAHFAEPLNVTDIAAAAGLGRRSLELAFRQASDGTPRARLTAIRLEQARRRLLTRGGDDGVTAIALECGFAHLGRFSQLYRRLYGELPSKTLRRGRLVG